MVIAVPTGIKIFSWINSLSFSKINFKMLFDKLLFKIYINLNNLNKIEFDLINLNLYNLFPRSNKNYVKPNNEIKELVIYGTNLESNVGFPKFTKIVTYMIDIPDNIRFILTGILLGKGYIKTQFKRKINKNKKEINELLKYTYNSRFSIKLSIKDIEYIWYIYTKISHYCISPPKIKIETLKNKKYKLVILDTRALPCISELRDTFYEGRKKIIPKNIYDLINYESLAHMIMCDAYLSNGKGIILNFKSFTVKELIYLINIFKIKWNLNCTLHKSRNLYTIYIKTKSVYKLYLNIAPFIIPSMQRKLHKKILDLNLQSKI